MRRLMMFAVMLATLGIGHTISNLSGITEKPIVVALNRIQQLSGINPQSTWLNQEERWIRLGIGAFWWQALCGSQATCPGNFSNLSVVPNGGVNVVVQPSVSNSIGTLYQLLPEETSGFGGYPSGVGVFLPADATQVMIQGTIAQATSAIGPLSPPLTTGQSITYLVECNILTVDTTSQPVNIVSAGGSVTPSTANRDRVDTVNCQGKAGVAATTGTQVTPTVDTGYVAVASVAVPFGTSTITNGMITANAPLAGNVFLSPGSAQPGSISVTGGIQSATSVTAPVIVSGNGYVQPALTASGGVTSSTEHSLHGSVTSAVVSGQPCSTVQYVTLSGAGAFTSAATYSAVANVDFTASTIPTGWTYAVAPLVQRVSGTSFGIQACGVVNAGSTGSLVINYITSGY